MASHQAFKRAAGLMLVAVMASRFLGLIREMLIARQFGQTGAVSAYTAAFNIPDLLYFFLSSGALSSAFIPEFTKRFEAGKQKEAWQIFSIIACFMGLVLTAAVAFAWVYARPLASLLAVPGFVKSDPKLVDLTVTLTRIILPCQLFFFLGGLMMATLESRQKFSARAAGPVIYNLGIIFGAVVLSRWFNIGGLAIGTLIGAFVGNIAYTYYCMRREGFEFHFSLNIRHPGVVRVAKLALPVIFGLGLPQIDVIVNKWFASFVSTTAPAALNYANRLMQVPLGIFAQAAGTAILPMLAVYAARNAMDDMRSGVAYGLRAIMVESIPATLFLVVMADPLVRTIYMSGEFRPSSVGVTVIPLIWYSVGIYAWAGQAIVARGFFALQDTITPVLIGTVSTAIFIPMNYFLMKAMGTGGIALATTVAVSLHFFGLCWFLRRRLHGIEGGRILSTVARIVVAALAMAVVCFGIRLGMSGLVGSWQLQDGDLRDPARMAVMLKDGRTPLDEYLLSKLSPKTLAKTEDYQTAEQLAPQLETALLDALNQQVTGTTLYDGQRFSRFNVPDDVLKTAAEHANTLAGWMANRHLLADCFPSIEDYRARRPWYESLLREEKNRPKTRDPWLLSSDDIIDLPDLALQLVDTKNPVSVYLMSELPEDVRSLVREFVAKSDSVVGLPKSLTHDAVAGLPQSLMRDLNKTITSEPLYSPERFAGVVIPSRLHKMIDSNPTGKRLTHLNRRLLEVAYPHEIVVRPTTRVESRMGSLLTVLAAMLIGGAIYLGSLRLMKVDELDYLWSAIRRRLTRRPRAVELDSGSEPVLPDSP